MADGSIGSVGIRKGYLVGNLSGHRFRHEALLPEVSADVKKVQEAIKLFDAEYSYDLSPDDTMKLKCFWYDQPHHGALFLNLTDSERVSYVRFRVQKLNA